MVLIQHIRHRKLRRIAVDAEFFDDHGFVGGDGGGVIVFEPLQLVCWTLSAIDVYYGEDCGVVLALRRGQLRFLECAES